MIGAPASGTSKVENRRFSLPRRTSISSTQYIVSNMSSNMPTNRPFLLNIFAAFRYKATSPPFSSTHIQSARAIATKAANPQSQQTSPRSQTQVPNPSSSHTAPAPTSQSSHYHTEQSSSSNPSNHSNPIPINSPERQRRGSDSSNGSAKFSDAIGSEKWYIGGRTPAGDERFYRLGMVTQGGGRLGGSGRVGSIDQLSL